jgi:flagellar motor switch protein FliM
MKVMCNLCGKISDLMVSTSFAADEGGQLKTFHFCCPEHLVEYTRKKGIELDNR